MRVSCNPAPTRIRHAAPNSIAWTESDSWARNDDDTWTNALLYTISTEALITSGVHHLIERDEPISDLASAFLESMSKAKAKAEGIEHE